MRFHQKICVVGLGYIGLPTASLLASRGYDVLGVDVNTSVVDTINSGRVHIVEPDLDVMVQAAIESGRLRASVEPGPADIFIIAVPTPFQGDYLPNLDYVRGASRSISPFLRNGNLVILESTSPVGTTRLVEEMIFQERPDLHRVHVAHCPERVLPGHVLRELIENDRIVGGLDAESTQTAVDFYKTFVTGSVLPTDASTAEMCKLAENAFRDVNIAYANELSMICDDLDIDTWELIKLANRHPRVNILQPGPGVGGHCIAVDPWFIVASSPQHSKLIRSAREVNDSKPAWVVEKIRVASEGIADPTILCLGLAFKANIDDLRESPALDIARQIRDAFPGRLLVCEPNIETCAEFELVTIDEGLLIADVVVLLVDHDQFKNISLGQLDGKHVVDTRGIW